MKALILASLCAGCSLPLQAEVLWQDVSVTYLNGSNYRVDGPDKQVLTFEHAAGTSWGDSFSSSITCALIMAGAAIMPSGRQGLAWVS